MPFKKISTFAALGALSASLLAQPALAATDHQEVVTRADATVNLLEHNPDYKQLDTLIARSKAVFVVPELVKGALVVGGEGGDGVLLSRISAGKWSAPAFYSIGSASFGLQIGGKSSEVMFIVLTDKGLNAILNDKVKLGADVSVAVVSSGKSLESAIALKDNTDILAVGKSDGLFAGASFDGAVISSRDSWDQDYYGRVLTGREILAGDVKAPAGAKELEHDLVK